LFLSTKNFWGGLQGLNIRTSARYRYYEQIKNKYISKVTTLNRGALQYLSKRLLARRLKYYVKAIYPSWQNGLLKTPSRLRAKTFPFQEGNVN